MTYEEMINEVCAGKTAFRATVPDVIVFREGDTIIRRSHRKIEINQIFIASVEEQQAHDWDVVSEDDDHDEVIYIITDPHIIGLYPFTYHYNHGVYLS